MSVGWIFRHQLDRVAHSTMLGLSHEPAIELAAGNGAHEVVIGMAHRGRLNVLAHNLGLGYDSILREFEGERTIDAVVATEDDILAGVTEVLVVGGGPGGYAAAFLAADLGSMFGGVVSLWLQKHAGLSLINARRSAFTVGGCHAGRNKYEQCSKTNRGATRHRYTLHDLEVSNCPSRYCKVGGPR